MSKNQRITLHESGSIDIAKIFGQEYCNGNHLFICQWEGKSDFMAIVRGTLHRHAGPNDLAIAQFARQFGKPTTVHRFTSAEEAHKAFPQVYRAPGKDKPSEPTKKC